MLAINMEDASYIQIFFNPEMWSWHTDVNIFKSVMGGRLLNFSLPLKEVQDNAIMESICIRNCNFVVPFGFLKSVKSPKFPA